ncbi:hypothetical protein MKD41_02120 [Lutibacter sp. A64]|uniref:YiiX/YebB-like N1pC/P60 family cysteine hydrolase n=1 Tax=Lutibacter sp. A64 TaxID=2918526 RepID=UPI001F06F09F|nr:YiiX/YebB-like N1pC/P60 family cysteine hydrolase [Lutibacter sp. A64]UMB54287.1 hypothetical protein MKD41_02120 [Lutibacter sp. A64]
MNIIKNIGYFLIVLLLGSSLFYYLRFINTNQSFKIVNFKNLQNGDLILRCGKSTGSYLVHLADKTSEYTHIGIIAIEKGTPYVIHAVPHKNNTLKKETFKKFLNPKKASSYAVYRSTFNAKTLSKVVNEAQKFYLKKCTFDNEYNLNTDNKLYCTELILKAFKNAGITLNIKERELKFVVGTHAIIFPSEFTKKPIFNRII